MDHRKVLDATIRFENRKVVYIKIKMEFTTEAIVYHEMIFTYGTPQIDIPQVEDGEN